MPPIRQYWVAGKVSQLSQRTFSYPRHLSLSTLSHNYVAIQGLYSVDHLAQVSFLPSQGPSKRHFTQCHHCGRSVQATHADQHEETALDGDERTQDSVPLDRFSVQTVTREKGAVAPNLHAFTGSKSQDTSRCVDQNESISEGSSASCTSGEIWQGNATGDLKIDERSFAASSGFWSLRQFDALLSMPVDDSPAASSAALPLDEFADFELNLARAELPIDPTFQKLWKPAPRSNKIDLSYWDPVQGERDEIHSEPPKQLPDSDFYRFRANRGDRKTVLRFITKIYPHVSSADDISEHAIRVLVRDHVLATLLTDHDKLVDTLTWSWVLLAPPARRIQRLLSLYDPIRAKDPPSLPMWLIMQLLRAESYSPQDFLNLSRLIYQNVYQWETESSASMTLIVRLMRHARASSPESLSTVIECFLVLLNRRTPTNPSVDDQRMSTHWCNRLLTLLSLPTPQNPFKYVGSQQNAQLRLLQYMQEACPRIQLNREGYRALMKLQIMHKKTPTEASWAKVQADTWPPWEKQHQMGVVSTRRMPGSTSRTNKVLQRMKEDGYSPRDFDTASQILAGRDSDGSPTLQVRRKPSLIYATRPWLAGHTSISSHKLWAARITATRTVREAWMGFCAYESACKKTRASHSYKTYLAMFRKLFAKTMVASSDKGPSPGDGIETFPDPELARDRVYVPEEVPSIQELYARMIANGVRPQGEMLHKLLLNERVLRRGLVYIKHAVLPDDAKTVLSSPEAYTPASMAQTLRQCPLDLVRGYLRLIARPHVPKSAPLPLFLSHDSHTLVAGPSFAGQVLADLGAKAATCWGDYFGALSSHNESSENDHRRIGLGAIWTLMGDVRTGSVDGRAFAPPKPDAFFLYHLVKTAISVQTLTVPRKSLLRYDPLDLVMKCFIESVSGVRPDWSENYGDQWSHFVAQHCQRNAKLHLIPKADVVQDVALLMLATQHENMMSDIIALLRWASCYALDVNMISRITKRNRAAFRVYLEGQWASDDPEMSALGVKVIGASQSQVEEARSLCSQLGGWASDEEVGEYLTSSQPIFARIRKKLKAVVQST